LNEKRNTREQSDYFKQKQNGSGKKVLKKMRKIIHREIIDTDSLYFTIQQIPYIAPVAYFVKRF